MERKENLCQPPEYPAEMFSEYIESAKARALRASEIEAILGDDYDLDRLRELVEADREGRCVVLPCKVEDDVYINICLSYVPKRKNILDKSELNDYDKKGDIYHNAK